jgi:ferritin-like metal-binding protein YciE
LSKRQVRDATADRSFGAQRNICCNGRITATSRFINKPEIAPMAKQEKQEKQLDELFHETLKDIYYAEKKLVSTLPKMAKAAHSDELKAAFEKHLAETEGQVERLEQVFAMIDETPKGKTCDAINGLVDEGKEIMSDFKRSPAHDAGLLAAAQAVEHYEISRYGTLRTWAIKLGMKDAAKLLDETLVEEKKTDEALTKLAVSIVNDMAELEAAA